MMYEPILTLQSPVLYKCRDDMRLYWPEIDQGPQKAFSGIHLKLLWEDLTWKVCKNLNKPTNLTCPPCPVECLIWNLSMPLILHSSQSNCKHWKHAELTVYALALTDKTQKNVFTEHNIYLNKGIKMVHCWLFPPNQSMNILLFPGC